MTTFSGEEDINTFDAAYPLMVKAGYCNDDETVVAWNKSGQWFAFRKIENSVKVKALTKKPKWFRAPAPKLEMVSILVPKHLVAEMRLHLGELANRKEVEA